MHDFLFNGEYKTSSGLTDYQKTRTLCGLDDLDVP